MKLERGIWVEAQSDARPLDSRAAIAKLVQTAVAYSVSDLYAQVYRGGYCWFRTFYGEHAQTDDAKLDPLLELLEIASKHNIRVHGWVNALNLGVNHSKNVAERLDAQSAQCDSLTRPICGAPKPPCPEALGSMIDTPGLWLDPSDPIVQNHLNRVVEELIGSYPGLHGLHLDFIRYPYFIPTRPASWIACGIEAGYGKGAISRFKQESGVSEPFLYDAAIGMHAVDEKIGLVWDKWRRDQVTAIVKRAKGLLRKGQRLSVAGICWPDRAYQNAMQDWPSWLRYGLIDDLALMAYTSDETLFSRLIGYAKTDCPADGRVLAGIGLYKLADQASFRRLIRHAESALADGVVCFSYGELEKRPELYSALEP